MAAAQPGAPQQAPNNNLLTTIREDIRNLIIGIKSKLNDPTTINRRNYNIAVNGIIRDLNIISGDIDRRILQLSPNGDTSTIVVNENNGNYITRRGNTYGGPNNHYLRGIVRRDDGTVGINAQHAINMNSLDETGTLGPTPQDPNDHNYRYANIDTNNMDQASVTALNNRLISCQHLEILYLLKHEELMKTFAFLLTLYKKYEYAIKILLFILKNIFTAQNIQPGQPGQPGEQPYQPPRAPGNMQIRMPKAIIKNIKKLLEDQKQVSEVIDQMQINMRNENLNNLLNPQRPPTRDNLTNPGNLEDINIP
jgi:hypothetical protein